VTCILTAQALIGLSVTPSGQLLRQDLLLVVPPPQRQQRANGVDQKAAAGPQGDAGGDRVTVAAPVGSPDAGGEAQAARARLAAAQALGQLAFMCRSGPTGFLGTSVLQMVRKRSLQHTSPGRRHRATYVQTQSWLADSRSASRSRFRNVCRLDLM